MTQEEFIIGVKKATSDVAVQAVINNLKHPPGRQPDPTMVALSEWFNSLPEEDKHLLQGALREAAETAVFSFLAVLDGEAFVEGYGEKGTFSLVYKKGNVETRLNDPNGEHLHDIYNWACRHNPVARNGVAND